MYAILVLIPHTQAHDQLLTPQKGDKNCSDLPPFLHIHLIGVRPQGTRTLLANVVQNTYQKGFNTNITLDGETF